MQWLLWMHIQWLLGCERQEHVLGHAAAVAMDAKRLLGKAGESVIAGWLRTAILFHMGGAGQSLYFYFCDFYLPHSHRVYIWYKGKLWLG